MLHKTLAIFVLLLAGFTSPALAQTAAELAFVKKLLFKLQVPSIAENVEYCGFIGYDSMGRLIASQAIRGEYASCASASPRHIKTVTASYHTHAGYSDNHIGEIPSGVDVDGDKRLGIDGYVSTPGGRLWHIDTSRMIISQVCGYGCLPKDRRFVKGSGGKIPQSYTYKELLRALGE